MASTIINDEEPKKQTIDFNADEILTDWFENNENNWIWFEFIWSKCIEKSIEDFSDIAEIILEKYDNKIICRVLNSKSDINLTVCEFSNYIIDLMNVI